MTDTHSLIAKVIKRGTEKGFSEDHICEVLLAKGYSRTDIEAARLSLRSMEHEDMPQRVETYSPGTKKKVQKSTIILSAICILLLACLAFSLYRGSGQVIEVEKIVEIPAECDVEDVLDPTLRERLDNYGEFSEEIDQKQTLIDEQLATISSLNSNMSVKDERISQLTKQLEEVHEMMKEERHEVVSLLVDILNYILGNKDHVG